MGARCNQTDYSFAVHSYWRYGYQEAKCCNERDVSGSRLVIDCC
jgi:hypothetical protein